MPLPRWLAQINKRVFNPREIKRGRRPVLTHVGRSSGRTYRTPLEAFPVDGGYIFVLMYGAQSDWARNVLAAGSATLTIDDREIELVTPRVLTDEADWQRLPSTFKRPPSFLHVSELLQMDVRTD